MARPTEEAVEKYSTLSDGYESRASASADLDRRYRKIGISAVAAAVRYQGEAKPAPRTGSADQTTAEPAA